MLRIVSHVVYHRNDGVPDLILDFKKISCDALSWSSLIRGDQFSWITKTLYEKVYLCNKFVEMWIHGWVQSTTKSTNNLIVLDNHKTAVCVNFWFQLLQQISWVRVLLRLSWHTFNSITQGTSAFHTRTSQIWYTTSKTTKHFIFIKIIHTSKL